MNISFLESSGLAPLPAFLTSLALGLLIGLERERNPSSKAGLRTFALVALLGTLAGLIAQKTGSPWILVAGLALVGAMMIAAYAREGDEAADPGTTSVAALCVCYGLGALIWLDYATLAILLGVITTLRLYNVGKLAPAQAAGAVVLALISNIAFKLGLVFAVGGAALGRRCAPAMLGAAATAGLVIAFLQE